MRRSSGVVPTGLVLLLASLLPGSVLSLSARADVPQSGFAPNLEAIGIRDIQRQLRAHGYDPGPDSGAMSDTTRAAILAYQHDYGLREDGVAGPALQNMLHFLRRRPAPPPAETSDDAVPPPAPPPAEAADGAVVPPTPRTALLQPPPPPQYEAPSEQPPQNPTALYEGPPAEPPPPVRYAEPPAAATQAPMALYPSAILPPPVSMPTEPSPPVHPDTTIAALPPAPARSATLPPTPPADPDAVVPPAPLAALLKQPPPIPVLGDIASLAPPPPAREPEAPLLDPLAVIAIPVTTTHAVAIAHSAYPDPLAVVAIETPVSKPRPKDEEPLPALALPPPIRLPVKTVALSSDDSRPVAVPRVPVASGPLGIDPAHPLPAPSFVPPPFSTAPTDAPELAGDLYVRQVQEYLKKLGFFGGEPNGVLDWATVEALVKFDASGAGPSSVIADPKHLDEVWIARLKTALAAKGAPAEAAPHP